MGGRRAERVIDQMIDLTLAPTARGVKTQAKSALQNRAKAPRPALDAGCNIGAACVLLAVGPSIVPPSCSRGAVGDAPWSPTASMP